MVQQLSDVLVLEEGQTPPTGTITPPRQPKWLDTFNYIANPDQFCRQNLTKYGPIFKTSVFGGTTIFVGSPRAVQMTFNGDLNYTDIALPATTMNMFGEYSLFQRPDLHRQRKSALSPGLTGHALNSYTLHMNQAIARGIQDWIPFNKIALYPAVEKICFNVLTPLLLGIDLNNSEFFNFKGLPVSSSTELKARFNTFSNGFYGLSKWQSRFTTYGRGLKARAELIEFMRAVVQRRRAEGGEINPTADFLSMMLAAAKENPNEVFTDALIENQCLLELWASHFQISGLVSSLLYKLGRYRQVLQQLRQEQTQVRGKQSNTSSIFSAEQLKQMKLLEATIKETLRTLPPSSTAKRQLTKSVVLDGVVYEKGCSLMAEPRIAHIIPENFSAPDVFAPERFLEESSESKKYGFIPFGGGVHACLGAQMAILVTKIFASHVLAQFDWELMGDPKFVQFPIKRIQDNYQINLSKIV
ncbi:MAG: cytochrome P450 [Rhizonema sp. PD38]|nr:cytochrome P450 [Rhizonema sp. PD38]